MVSQFVIPYHSDIQSSAIFYLKLVTIVIIKVESLEVTNCDLKFRNNGFT